MNKTVKNWSWFVALMLLLVAAGLYLGRSRRPEPGKSFDYSIEEYRRVNPALVQYREIEPLEPSLLHLTALAIGPDGTVYVGGDQAVEALPSGRAVTLEKVPSGLAVSEEGLLYVCMQDRMAVFSPEGTPLEPPVSAFEGNPYLTAIAVSGETVYLADAGNRCIWKVDPSTEQPIRMESRDAEGAPRPFYVPSPFFDLAISPADGSLWAVNPGHHAFENYRPDGTLLGSWERSGFDIEGFSGCCNPSYMALLPDGGFVTTEKGLPRVKIHEPDGSLRCVVAVPDQFDRGVVGLDVAVDAEGVIHVLDPARRQVRRFREGS